VSSADILVDGFPHGTPAGYDQGCKSGGLCPNKGTDAMTCKEAKTRYNSDAAYRREIDGTPAPKPRLLEPAKKPTITGLADDLRAKLNAPDFPHGTNGGYQRGCRAAVEQYCPGDSDGRTCAQANREYKAEYTKNRKADEALKAAGIAPKDRAAAVAGSLALAAAGEISVDETSETAAAAIGDFDLSDYDTTDGPDIAVDGLLEALDDARQRLTASVSAGTELQTENTRLLELTETQTSTILRLRERITEHESTIADRDATIASLIEQRNDLNTEVNDLFAEKERAIEAYVVDHDSELADPRVHLDLDPQQAANVILALAGGAR
jgi:hypothetical protein